MVELRLRRFSTNSPDIFCVRVKHGQIQYFTKPKSTCSLQMLAFSLSLGFYAIISSVFSSCRISWIHFSFLFIGAARFFLVNHKKIPFTVIFFTSFALTPHFFKLPAPISLYLPFVVCLCLSMPCPLFIANILQQSFYPVISRSPCSCSRHNLVP
jgi:hypothetical protein